MVLVQVIFNFIFILPSLIIGIIIIHTNSLNKKEIEPAHAINSCVFLFVFCSK